MTSTAPRAAACAAAAIALAAGMALAAPPADASLGDSHDRYGWIDCAGPLRNVTVHARWIDTGDGGPKDNVHLAVGNPDNGPFIRHDVLKWSHWESKSFPPPGGHDLEWHAADHGGDHGEAIITNAYVTCRDYCCAAAPHLDPAPTVAGMPVRLYR